MSATYLGPTTWRASKDDDGHREYTVEYLVRTNSADDGPQTVGNVAGLPATGDFYSMGNDSDVWAICHPRMKIDPHEQQADGQGFTQLWKVERVFSTRPIKRCQDSPIEDPLLEPQKISGSFVKLSKQIKVDRYGNPLVNSSHEPLSGSELEFDFSNPTVRIEQNVGYLGLEIFSPMINTLNDATLWGMPSRYVKLSNVTWDRKVYGTCNYYYTRIFEFEINYLSFDRTTPDSGNMVLRGYWADTNGDKIPDTWQLLGNPDPENPKDFVRYRDQTGELARVFLNGFGLPADTSVSPGTGSAGTGSGPPGTLSISHYTESNFLLLGIPTIL